MTDKTLTAICHCRTTHFTLTLPSTTLPLQVHLCHCSVCRTVHGAPCSFHAPIPPGVEPVFIVPSSLDKLTGYVHANAKGTRYFCSTCGCHIGDHDRQGHWYISVSIFEEGNACAWEITSYPFTHSTRDGGISSFLREIDGRELTIWNPVEASTADEPVPVQEGEGEEEEETLLAQCHCGGVSMKISRPRDTYLASTESRDWIQPSYPTRWTALLDLCSDCRLVTGTHLIGWLFVPKDYISPPIPDDLRIGTAKSYRSSDDVLRTFCGTCGATVFAQQAGQGSVVGIATGLVRCTEGVMLGNWAWWRTIQGGFPQDGVQYDSGFARALIEGLRAWRIKQYGEVAV